MIKLRKASSVGGYWTQSSKTNGTWNDLCVTSTGRIIAVSSSTINCIWGSDDNGETWHVLNNLSDNWGALCITSTGRIIAGNCDGKGLWYSDDNGGTWTQSNKTDKSWKALCVTPTGRIIAGSGNNLGVWYSDDNGLNWTQSEKTNGYVTTLGVTSTGILFAGSDSQKTFAQSTNNGINWSVVSGSSSITSYMIDSIYIKDDVVYVSTGGGLFKNNADYTTWSKIYNSSCRGVIIIDNIIIAVLGSKIKYSKDNGANWIKPTPEINGGYAFCVTPTGRLIVGGYSNGIWYSDTTESKNAREKYLDQKGAQEIVTQFKAYCDSLVGGA